MTRGSPNKTRRNSITAQTSSSGTPRTDGLEERVLAFAEQLGHASHGRFRRPSARHQQRAERWIWRGFAGRDRGARLCSGQLSLQLR